MDFTCQESGFVHSSIGIMRNIQEGVIGIADATDRLGLVSIILLISAIRRGFFLLFVISKTNSNTNFTFTGAHFILLVRLSKGAYLVMIAFIY